MKPEGIHHYPVANGGSEKRSVPGVSIFPRNIPCEPWGAGWSYLRFANHLVEGYKKVGKHGNSWKYVDMMKVKPVWTREKGHSRGFDGREITMFER